MTAAVELATDAAAGELVAAARGGDAGRTLQLLQQVLGLPRSVAPARDRRPPVKIYRWVCPVCDGDGRDVDGDRCLLCAGYGLTNDVEKPAAWGDRLRPAPRPPAVMRAPCGDCAYRPGAPEEEPHLAASCTPALLVRPDAGAPFYCHHGMHRIGDGYESPAYVGSLPLGAMVCAGWWALATGEQLPERPYRELPGADRAETPPPSGGGEPGRT